MARKFRDGNHQRVATVKEAKRRPDKVRAAIQMTLDKAVQKAAEKPVIMRVSS